MSHAAFIYTKMSPKYQLVFQMSHINNNWCFETCTQMSHKDHSVLLRPQSVFSCRCCASPRPTHTCCTRISQTTYASSVQSLSLGLGKRAVAALDFVIWSSELHSKSTKDFIISHAEPHLQRTSESQVFDEIQTVQRSLNLLLLLIVFVCTWSMVHNAMQKIVSTHEIEQSSIVSIHIIVLLKLRFSKRSCFSACLFFFSIILACKLVWNQGLYRVWIFRKAGWQKNLAEVAFLATVLESLGISWQRSTGSLQRG